MFSVDDAKDAADILADGRETVTISKDAVFQAAKALPKIEGVRFLRNVWVLSLREAEAALTIIKGGKQ